MSVVTVTLNPCIDKTCTVERMVPEDKLSAKQVREYPGGGGINVARVITRLGESTCALWSGGGPNAQLLSQLLDEERVSHRLVPMAGNVRENIIITDASEQHQYRIGMPGQALADDAVPAWLEALRAAPPSDEELENWSAERQGRERQRDDWCRLLNALKDVLKQKAASDWHAAEGLLSERGALAPALEEEHTRSIGALSSVEQELRVLEAQWERDTESAQKAGAEVAALDAHLSRTRLELTADGVGDTEGALEAQLTQALQLVERMDQMCASLRTDAQSRAAAAARADEQRRAAEAELNTLDAELRQLEAALQPVKLAGETLTEAALAEGVLALVKRAGLEESFAGWGSDALQNEAHKELSLLRERLNQSHSGQRVAQELGELISSSATPSWLAVWESVRGWLAERVPTRIAESGDPLQSLSKLREELHRLEHRLVAQESELRGESRDVARNIEVQVRKATNQVRRLNQHLSRVSFGTISAIRVRLERVERMAKILEALHEGAAQSLLFHSGMPIEEAMDEIFRRYGGGRGGGQKLLDYREYLELNVEVQRRGADAWERASPSRLSTGEAIGVGAALMMVILAEWERDANLLRAKKTLGTLRFLFLDEANRLSRDNLSVLFELCETLELQLLIAAPEVAQVEHNTTYRLVRRVDELGEEEVVVTGRRGTSASVPSQAPLFQVAPSDQNGERAPTGPLLDDLV